MENVQDWSLGAWNAVQIYATIYGIVVSALTLILVFINILKLGEKYGTNKKELD